MAQDQEYKIVTVVALLLSSNLGGLVPVEIQLPSYLAIFSEQKYITLLYIKMTNIRKSFLINKILYRETG